MAEYFRAPLIRLPPSEWRIIDSGPDHFGISIYGRMHGTSYARHWQKWSILDFPNDLFGFEELERAGLMWRYMAAIEKAELEAAAMKAGVALDVGERNQVSPLDHGIGAALRIAGQKALLLLQSILPTRFFQQRG